jgi:hypothetical protein
MSARLRRALPAILFLIAVAGFFLVANRAAYRGYFVDDELDDLAFTGEIDAIDYVQGLLLPRFYTNNFRPAGHLFFYAMGKTARLRFAPYIAVLHILHIANVVLLWLVLRRLSLPALASAAGILLFAFHMATFDIYWKPMYVFDLLCGTFCLLSIFFWLGDRWILSLIAFWVAYRAKEIAVMLPLVLAACEYFLAGRRWRRLIPFFAISLWFGIQGMLTNRPGSNDYSLHFRPGDIWHCAVFYSGKLLLAPYDGWAVLAVLVVALVVLVGVVRDRRLWIGLIAFAALLAPMLLLPGRLSGAYLYVPLIGLAIALAALASQRWVLIVVGIGLACWIPWNYLQLRAVRREVMEQAVDRRQFVAAMDAIARTRPEVTSYVFPHEDPLTNYGVRAAGRLLHPKAQNVLAASEDSATFPEVIHSPWLAYISVDKTAHRVYTALHTPATPDWSYIRMGPSIPIWQLTGWYPGDGAFRWSKPHASARLFRPSDATVFEMYINVSGEYLARLKRSRVELSLNGVSFGGRDITQSDWQTLRWMIPAGPSGPVEITIDVSPPYPAAEPLGVAVGALGFQ